MERELGVRKKGQRGRRTEKTGKKDYKKETKWKKKEEEAET